MNRWLPALWVVLLAGACGGNVETGGSSSGGSSSGGSSSGGSSSGGSSSGGSSSGGSSSGGSSGSGASGGSSTGGSGGTSAVCSGYTDCCQRACTNVVEAVKCPSTPDPGCGCDMPSSGVSGTCVARLTDLYRCLLEVGPQAFKCDQNGGLALRCGFCKTQVQRVVKVCNQTQVKCTY